MPAMEKLGDCGINFSEISKRGLDLVVKLTRGRNKFKAALPIIALALASRETVYADDSTDLGSSGSAQEACLFASGIGPNGEPPVLLNAGDCVLPDGTVVVVGPRPTNPAKQPQPQYRPGEHVPSTLA